MDNGVTVEAVPGHDLPPLWDGRQVDWRGWEIEPWTSAEYHHPRCCAYCGTQGSRRSMNVGTVHPLPGETWQGGRIKKAKRSGREYQVGTTIPARPITRLYAYRCRDCGIDEVYDSDTDEHWVLDDSDYGDNGSVPPLDTGPDTAPPSGRTHRPPTERI